MSNYNDDRYDSEYDNDRQDSLLTYFYNLVVSPRTLGQQNERDPKIFGTSLIVYIPFVIYILKFTSFMSDTMSYSPLMLFLYVIIIVIHICVEIGVVAFILFVLNKLFRGEMRYKEAISVTLFPRMIIFIGLLLFSFLNEISFGSILIPIALIFDQYRFCDLVVMYHCCVSRGDILFGNGHIFFDSGFKSLYRFFYDDYIYSYRRKNSKLICFENGNI